jgi:hypothetical protein
MNDFKTDKAVFTTEDFHLWDTNGLLDLTPKFQRRPVWKPGAKSFLIDTILRGMTVPPIYLRNTQDEKTTKSIRQVVDGQQRIRTVLDFSKPEGFRLSKTLDGPWAGKRFSGLHPDEQRRILQFGFSCEAFKGISDQQVLEVFCRLNIYGVPLNRQELRNGNYFGPFKQTCYTLAFDYLEFWRTNKVFTEMAVARMLEVELTSELLIAGNAGMQDKKKSIDSFYDQWEKIYPNKNADEKRFKEVMSVLSETFPAGALAQTEFRRAPMFYTLYCVVYHHIHGLPERQRESPKKKLTADDRESLKNAVIELSDIVTQAKDPSAATPPQKYNAFILASARQTDNIKPRRDRFSTLYDSAFK